MGSFVLLVQPLFHAIETTDFYRGEKEYNQDLLDKREERVQQYIENRRRSRAERRSYKDSQAPAVPSTSKYLNANTRDYNTFDLPPVAQEQSQLEE